LVPERESRREYPRRPTRRRTEVVAHLIFLPLMIVILEVKVKIRIVVIRKTMVRKQR